MSETNKSFSGCYLIFNVLFCFFQMTSSLPSLLLQIHQALKRLSIKNAENELIYCYKHVKVAKY